MLNRIFNLTILLLFISACSSVQPPEPIVLGSSAQDIHFLRDVKPILDKRCVACHSCYNAPCQTKFSSFEGIARGGTKQQVYNATRLSAVQATRLFQDAQSTQEWRNLGFYSVVQDRLNDGSVANDLMSHLLQHKMEHPEIIGDYDPEYETLMCPRDQEELAEYFEEKPNHGMPYGFPALEESEYQTLIQWLANGAPGPSEEEQTLLITPSIQAQAGIEKWEQFFNQADAKHTLTARYLFEHLYLAHINFSAKPDEFYRLVRSRTAAPEAIDEIVTTRPFDDPNVERVYYRFQKIHSTIVHKTHMVFTLNEAKFARIKQLFIDTQWEESPHYVGYDNKERANPFLLYSQIPTRSRYQFLLDNSHYIIMTFIRGPVCRGQMALNVIHDHFWVMFQDPEYDLSILQPHFLLRQADNLSMPIESNEQSILKTFTRDYYKRYKRYANAKFERLNQVFPSGIGYEGIWKGEVAADSPMLTIYRHFNNASVHKGALGSMPRTLWVIDYAQLERIYYNLVAGYDVFGNVAHQANVRRYMDFLRIEGEVNFLSYMPAEVRLPMFRSWYIGHDYEDLDDEHRLVVAPSGVEFQSDSYKEEFIQHLVDKHFLAQTNIHFDELNYLRPGEEVPPLPDTINSMAELKTALKTLTLPGTGFLTHINDYGVNTIHIRLTEEDAKEHVITMVVNRWHDNVFSQFTEDSTLAPEKDSLDFIYGSVGSYINAFVELKLEDMADFLHLIKNFNGSEEHIAKGEKYFIYRSDPRFWQSFDWFQEHFKQSDPIRSGLYDLNRYHRSARE